MKQRVCWEQKCVFQCWIRYLLPFPFLLVEFLNNGGTTTTWEAKQPRRGDLSGQFIRNVVYDHLTVSVRGYDLGVDERKLGELTTFAQTGQSNKLICYVTAVFEAWDTVASTKLLSSSFLSHETVWQVFIQLLQTDTCFIFTFALYRIWISAFYIWQSLCSFNFTFVNCCSACTFSLCTTTIKI